MKCRELALNLIKKARGECQTVKESYNRMLKVNDIYCVTTVILYRVSLSQLSVFFAIVVNLFFVCFFGAILLFYGKC